MELQQLWGTDDGAAQAILKWQLCKCLFFWYRDAQRSNHLGMMGYLLTVFIVPDTTAHTYGNTYMTSRTWTWPQAYMKEFTHTHTLCFSTVSHDRPHAVKHTLWCLYGHVTSPINISYIFRLNKAGTELLCFLQVHRSNISVFADSWCGERFSKYEALQSSSG